MAVKEIESLIANKAEAKRFVLYSGHDLGPMMPLLASFKVWDAIWTPYASLIAWELLRGRRDGEYALRFIYNGRVLRIPGCNSSVCALNDFLSVAKNLIPTEEDCAVGDTDNLSTELLREMRREIRSTELVEHVRQRILRRMRFL